MPDPDDYEVLQDLYTTKSPIAAEGDGGPLLNIFDAAFNGAAHSQMYRSWVVPELFPGQPQPRLENWSKDDLIAYVGGEHAKAAYDQPATNPSRKAVH